MSGRRVLYAITVPETATCFLRGQLGHLTRAGFDVHLACEASPDLQRFAEEEGVTLHDVPLTRSWLALADVKGVWRAVRVLRTVRPDVLNYSTPKASLVWAVASRLRRPDFVVYLLRGLRLEGERRWSVGFLLLWLTELLAARCADVVVCVSDELRTKALGLHLMREDDAVVLGKGSSNGVSSERFRPAPERRRETRRHLGFADSDVVVGFVGRLIAEKGLYDLLDAVSLASSDVRCLLVGKSELDVDVEALLAERGLLDRVTVIEFTRDISSYYAAMDLLVLPSRREGMPNALLEAQAMGLPCIASDATGCRDAVAADETALVVPVGSPADLARAIDRLAKDPEMRARFGASGRRRVLEHFRQEDHWDRYAQLYSGHGREAATAKGRHHARDVA
jgi:glycosyltransferase involved in cell wall biosynthesis